MKLLQIKLPDSSPAILHETPTHKTLISPKYNFIFDKITGSHARWGETPEHNGSLFLGMPEIADIEISTVCSGVKGVVCPFCYKGNTANGDNMTLETFKQLFAKLPPTVTQIAFGIGDIQGNPDFWDILAYTRANGVIPNITTNGEGIDQYIAGKLSEACGAVAVSLYDKNTTYNAISKLTTAGLKQVNIHFMISEQTYQNAIDLFRDFQTDDRLEKLRAIVLLSLKQKGRAVNNFTRLDQDKFNNLVNIAFDGNIPLGFDSCSATKFMEAVKNFPNKDELYTLCEPCESTLYSSYFDVHAKYYPCSFMEGMPHWKEGLEVIGCDDFMEDVWMHERTKVFRLATILNRAEKKACVTYQI